MDMTQPTLRGSRRGGLTLIEVLLVLVILVIIASLAVTAYGPMEQKARINATKTQLSAFKTPLQAYKLDLGTFPSTAQGLDALRTVPSGLTSQNKWNGPYLDSAVPLDPWGNQYQYEFPGKQQSDLPDIWSMGPDGINNNEDDIGNWMRN
jgi:general secretion pathway protein G